MDTKQPPRTPSRLRRFLLWSFVAVAACVFALGIFVHRTLAITDELRVLKKTVFAAPDHGLDPIVQFSVGRPLTSLVSLGTRLIPDMPSEARELVRSLKNASVAVYQRDHDAMLNHSLVSEADVEMRTKGWMRVVAVHDAHTTVLVYVSDNQTRIDNVEVCVAVIEPANVVLVSAQMDAERLVPLVQSHLAARRVAQL